MDPKLFHNVLSAENGRPHRLTERQSAHYRAKSSAFRDRAECTAGCCLKFRTDAGTLSFQYETSTFCRSCNVVDVFENGIHTGSVRLADMQYEGRFVYHRPAAEGLIELWLPNTCGLRITEADFGDAVCTEHSGERALLLGDSILQGICSYFPSQSVADRIARHWDIETVNQSVGGARFEPEMPEPLEDVSRVLISYGANDAFSSDPLEEIADTVIRYAERLCSCYPAAAITFLTPVWTVRRKDPELNERFAFVTDSIASAAADIGASLICGDDLIPHMAQFFNEDGIHPNDLGFSAFAGALFEKGL